MWLAVHWLLPMTRAPRVEPEHIIGCMRHYLPETLQPSLHVCMSRSGRNTVLGAWARVARVHGALGGLSTGRMRARHAPCSAGSVRSRGEPEERCCPCRILAGTRLAAGEELRCLMHGSIAPPRGIARQERSRPEPRRTATSCGVPASADEQPTTARDAPAGLDLQGGGD